MVFKEENLCKTDLTRLEIKNSYDSDSDDVLNTFYIPALSESVCYCRLAGYFTSGSLAIAARGIQKFIENNGKMKLVCGAVLSPQDIESIKKAYKTPLQVIEDFCIKEINSISEKIIEDHVKALGWMIANNHIEIKIAIVKNPSRDNFDKDELFQSGIFHQKVGILIDEKGNKLSFSGSYNETLHAWNNNIEEFKVFKSWEDGEKKYLDSDINKFNNFWNNKTNRTEIISLPEAVKNEFLKISPKDLKEINLEKYYKNSHKLNPWPHQSKAISAWNNNNYFGIFKMATGTGKTFTACFAIRESILNNNNNRILIIVPDTYLIDQWFDDINLFFNNDIKIFKYKNNIKKVEKSDLIHFWENINNLEKTNNIFVVINIDQIKNFYSLINNKPNIVIGDEVHSYGTQLRYDTLYPIIKDVPKIIGLSATPKRFFDSDGTKRVFDLFGNIIYSYDLDNAIEDKVLSNYYYNIYPAFLNEDELKKVDKLTNMIIAKHNQNEIKDELMQDYESSITKLLIKRARIIKKATNKYDMLKNILLKNKYLLNKCIVYCEDQEQLEKVRTIFEELHIKSYVIYKSEMHNRKDAIDLFKDDQVNFVLSMHCLNQGVNIPTCESIILFSSSSNPREFIQRRGRVLRNPPGSLKNVNIFDLIVLPKEKNIKYRGFITTQLIRVYEFIKSSNSPESWSTFNNICYDYNIDIEEIKKCVREWNHD